HSEEVEWLSRLQEADLNRVLETDRLPGYQLSVSQIAMQVCLHSHGHRAQCTTRLRLLGGTPPVMDFVHWLKARSAPEWL
ncbi:MAG: DinB family protein, partial [Alphaproteobacteria bacterium]